MSISTMQNRSALRCMLGAALVVLAFTTFAQAQNPFSSARTQPHVIDFSAFAGRSLESNGPIDVGYGIVWSAWKDGWIGDMAFGLRTNGYWNADRIGFAGLNAGDSAMTFTFGDPVNRVGAFVNYAPLSGQGPIPTIEALDEFDNVIDTLSLDIRTPNGVNDGQFLGFLHEEDDIFSFRYRARYGVLDNLTFSRLGHRGIIPAPSSLTALGVVFLGFGRRRRRAY